MYKTANTGNNTCRTYADYVTKLVLVHNHYLCAKSILHATKIIKKFKLLKNIQAYLEVHITYSYYGKKILK